MKHAIRTVLLAATFSTVLSAHAGGVRAADVPHMTNGGTGYIGLTASAGTPREAFQADRSHVQRVPLRAGEASTMVNGRPNADPDAPWADGAPTAGMRTAMGAAPNPLHRGEGRATHPGWGTPD